MLFNSLLFATFFAVVLALHQARAPWWLRKSLLLLASYIFYAAWNPPFVLLLAFSTLVDWSVARRMAREERPGHRKALLAVSLATNLGLLATFKYGDFTLQNLDTMAGLLGSSWKAPRLGWVLPVGISFYTFQTLSYTIDVYRRRLAADVSLLDFSLFVSFFPQLVAGPIVRATDFLPQLATEQRTTRRALAFGLVLLIVGLFQKVVLADTLLAPTSDIVFATDEVPDVAAAWVGALAFSGQIYCDFSGYSLCAIGVAACLGFRLPANFQAPYAALGFGDFWRRWHITLSTWLRDYLYIPLGGSRHGQLETLRNLAITMLLGGLWHGAAWNFVVWGAMHGALLAVERMVTRHINWGGSKVYKLLHPALALLTFGIVTVLWVPFRAADWNSAQLILAGLVGKGAQDALSVSLFKTCSVGLVVTGLLATHWLWRDAPLAQALARVPPIPRVAALSVMLTLVLLVRGNDQAFIYFQF